MQFRYASSTNLSSGRHSCMCEYSSESAGSEGGVHHTAAGDIQGEKELLQLHLSSRTADIWRFARKPYCAASTNVSHLAQAHFCLKCLWIIVQKRWMYSHHFFAQWYLQVAGCWPKNALGEPGLTSCLSAGHLLDSIFVCSLAEVSLCAREH